MAETWRERHHREHWTKRIDISFLYQLEMISAQMKERAEKQDDKELLEWAWHLRRIVSAVNGELVNADLSAHAMPEDVMAKIPDTRK